MKLGYIGLGKMGKNMVLHLLEQDVEVVAWNRSPEPREEVKAAGADTTETVEELIEKAGNPGERIIWLMLPAGDTTDEFIDKILPLLSKGDLLIDGANSLYKDTLRRLERIKDTGVHFMDIGVSGGPKGARTGACLMIGGAVEDFERIKEIAKLASAENAYQHLGPTGAGHLAKMVHNAIEYGMMESLGEGLAVLKYSEFKYDFSKLLDLYNHKSVIESRLVTWAKNAFDEDPELTDTSSTIGSGGGGAERVKGEGDWTLELGKELGVDMPSIEESIKVRSDSSSVEETSPNGFRNKVVSALRGQFGGHSVKKS